MSARSQVIEIVENLLQTKGGLTISEVQQKLNERGVVLSPKSTVVRATIYQLKKKEPRLVKVGRGTYQLIPNPEINLDHESTDDSSTTAIVSSNTMEIEDPINIITEQLLNILSQIERANWLEGPEEEVLQLRKDWNRVKLLYKTLGKKIHKIESLPNR